jgi:hypothetical protein
MSCAWVIFVQNLNLIMGYPETTALMQVRAVALMQERRGRAVLLHCVASLSKHTGFFTGFTFVTGFTGFAS